VRLPIAVPDDAAVCRNATVMGGVRFWKVTYWKIVEIGINDRWRAPTAFDICVAICWRVRPPPAVVIIL
jgi:hypothetical protein